LFNEAHNTAGEYCRAKSERAMSAVRGYAAGCSMVRDWTPLRPGYLRKLRFPSVALGVAGGFSLNGGKPVTGR
jgi:hypothetical protein